MDRSISVNFCSFLKKGQTGAKYYKTHTIVKKRTPSNQSCITSSCLLSITWFSSILRKHYITSFFLRSLSGSPWLEGPWGSPKSSKDSKTYQCTKKETKVQIINFQELMETKFEMQIISGENIRRRIESRVWDKNSNTGKITLYRQGIQSINKLKWNFKMYISFFNLKKLKVARYVNSFRSNLKPHTLWTYT